MLIYSDLIDKARIFLLDDKNLRLVLIITGALVIFLFIIIVLLMVNAKKKKYRKALEALRKRIKVLKHNDVINNYTTYDNLKNDQKLGLLVLRWKKSIESLVREIDAQYAMLDVLEDSIDSNNYKDFNNLIEQIYSDVEELEKTAEQLNDEISEYVDKASDNRRYINKYHEMYTELREKFKENEYMYDKASDQIGIFFDEIGKKFTQCHKLIRESKFEEADGVAAIIFRDIKLIDRFLDVVPGHLSNITNSIIPAFEKLEDLGNKFSKEELDVLEIDFHDQFKKNYHNFKELYENIYKLEIDSIDAKIVDIENFLSKYTVKLEAAYKNKNYVVDNFDYQKEYIKKIENTAKNFISIFKVVKGSYNITDKEILKIEDLLNQIETIKQSLNDFTNQFKQKMVSYDELKEHLEMSYKELTKISKFLDENIKIIDSIYSDEKDAREKIAEMSEKINGTKKYIKYANLSDQEKYLKQIQHLNMELTNLYVLLSEFPIDIISLNNSLDTVYNKVEKTTQELNSKIYKTLMTEFVLMYANRYFSDKQYQKDLYIAENMFYNYQYNKAYDKVMNILEKINPDNKKLVLEKYQEKFSEIFN